MAKSPKKRQTPPELAKPPQKPKPPHAKPARVREDVNVLAARIVAEATGQLPKTPDPESGKDPAAVQRGQKGGRTGGKARAARLTKNQRSKIAKKAAITRWHGANSTDILLE